MIVICYSRCEQMTVNENILDLHMTLGPTDLGDVHMFNKCKNKPNSSFIHLSHGLSQRKTVDQIQGKFQIWEEMKPRSIYLDQQRVAVEEKEQLYQLKKSTNE